MLRYALTYHYFLDFVLFGNLGTLLWIITGGLNNSNNGDSFLLHILSLQKLFGSLKDLGGSKLSVEICLVISPLSGLRSLRKSGYTSYRADTITEVCDSLLIFSWRWSHRLFAFLWNTENWEKDHFDLLEFVLLCYVRSVSGNIILIWCATAELWRPASLSRFSLLKHAKPFFFFDGKVFSVSIAHEDTCRRLTRHAI